MQFSDDGNTSSLQSPITWETDRQLAIIRHSNSAIKLWPEQPWLTNRSLYDLLSDTDNLLLKAHLSAIHGIAANFEYYAGGHYYLVSTLPKPTGEGCYGCAIDISHYKIKAHVSTLLKNQNQSILEAAGEGIYGLNLQGEATFVNPAALKMTGWSEDEVLGKNIHLLQHHTKPDGSHYPQHECPIYAAVRDGEVHFVDSELFWRKDGSHFPVAYTSTPIYTNGELSGAVVVFKDISERKKNEARLLQAFQEVKQLKEQLQEQNSYLRNEIKGDHNNGAIIGSSTPIKQLLTRIKQAAPTDASILILGESGTGKELIARAIHEQSQRHDKPLVKINCGAITSNLVESELFGHEKGAYTGASSLRKGRFELADGGTLFLDEVGELPPETQVKLLRVLQEQEFERVGNSTPIKVDVRIVAATNRNLEEMVHNGTFRQDLFYRLNVFPISAPPLRGRHEDIRLLAEYFIAQSAKKFGNTIRGLCPNALNALQYYSWPGNVRELQNVIERAAILSTGPIISEDELLPIIQPITTQSSSSEPLLSMRDMERKHIEHVLEKTHGIISGPKGAAALLQLHPNTLRSRMLKLRIKF